MPGTSAVVRYLLIHWKPILCLSLTFITGYKTALKVHPPQNVAEEQATQVVLANQPASQQIRIGLQAGHWKNEELPDELDT
jgi:hypothetical protein